MAGLGVASEDTDDTFTIPGSESQQALDTLGRVYQAADQKITEVVRTLILDLDEGAVRTITTYALAGADGLFVQREISGDAVDLVAMFELHAQLVYEAAMRMAGGNSG
ncbi:hypothetical protein GCM10010103_13560 [Streptomyces paradoxus]|uniref:Uncharacterized protein n=1 Tax=Streptomyces paradoxus TaxID=66375 RepID=A0A7W9T7D4_9ACTN|nr:hypothetical protein [Streptomyces paradoxus]